MHEGSHIAGVVFHFPPTQRHLAGHCGVIVLIPPS